jgi:hypothetical protein
LHFDRIFTILFLTQKEAKESPDVSRLEKEIKIVEGKKDAERGMRIR